MNLYAYVHSDPLNASDPSGMQTLGTNCTDNGEGGKTCPGPASTGGEQDSGSSEDDVWVNYDLLDSPLVGASNSSNSEGFTCEGEDCSGFWDAMIGPDAFNGKPIIRAEFTDPRIGLRGLLNGVRNFKSSLKSWTKTLRGTKGVLSKGDRIKMIVEGIGKINAKNADDALKQVNQIVNRIEDAHSGVKKVKNPGKAYDGRMYGPRSDSVTRHADGSITAKINKGTLQISADGKVKLSK